MIHTHIFRFIHQVRTEVKDARRHIRCFLALHLQLFVVVVWNFELYMLPLALLLLLLWNYLFLNRSSDTVRRRAGDI